MLALAVSSPAFATVVVNAPLNGSTVGSSVKFSASANTGCSKGVAAMGIYVDNSLRYQINGASVNTSIPISAGGHNVAVQEWDFCGGSTNSSLHLTVSTAAAGVYVSIPTNGSTVAAVSTFAATSTTSCPSGVSAMGVYVNGSLKAVQQGSSLNTQVSMGSGIQNPVIQSWDNCGGSAQKQITVTVGQGGGNNLANLQAVGGWNQWGELSPSYNICNAPCGGEVTWAMYQHQKNTPSGNGTMFNIGGTKPYSDVLWSLKLIGQGTQLNIPDTNRTIIPNIHNMTYTADIYPANMSAVQDIELDVNLYQDGVGMQWGTECNHLNGGVWDIWNNIDAHWVPTSIPCNLNNQQWNHVSFTVQRQSNNDLTYKTITVNGVTYSINQTVAPFPVPSTWYGMTANYQLDGNYRQAGYSTTLDNLSVTYW